MTDASIWFRVNHLPRSGDRYSLWEATERRLTDPATR